MSGLRSWLGNLPVAAKLGAILAIAVLTVGAFGFVGFTALNTQLADARALERINGMTRRALEADMAHDALRGDVLRALVVANGGGVPADAAEASADLAEHGKILREAMAY